jgi:hypothetical protein
MLRGADSRVGRGVKNKPHLLNDLAKAKGRNLIRAYESNPYPAAKNPYPAFPTKQLKQFARDSTIGYAREAATNIRHPIRRLTQHDQQMAFPGGPGKFGEEFEHPPVYAPRSVGDSADPMVRALNRLSASSPNNVAKLLIEAGSPIRRLLDARLGAKPIHSTGSLMDTHGGLPQPFLRRIPRPKRQPKPSPSNPR